MDKKRLEELDFFVRLDAFKHLNAIIRELTVFDEKIGFLLIYNCCYFLNNVSFYYIFVFDKLKFKIDFLFEDRRFSNQRIINKLYARIYS
jgi:hypothetical protein